VNISDLFADLSFGELATLALASDGDGLITDAGKERVIRFANDGLLKLYTRFVLKQSDVLIDLVEHITNYHLSKKFAQSQAGNTTQTDLYIKDLYEEPFSDDVIRILSVFSSEGGELRLNDENDRCSVFTPQPTVLQVPDPVDGVTLSIGYQAKHPVLTLADLTQEIELPDVLHPALRDWIAYRTFNQMKTQEAQADAQSHLSAYEATCNEVILTDAVSQSQSTTNNRFQQNGWA
jgi:hypothetical protein